VVVTKSNFYPRICLKRVRSNMKSIISMANVTDEIRTDYLPSRNADRYRCAKPLRLCRYVLRNIYTRHSHKKKLLFTVRYATSAALDGNVTDELQGIWKIG
jgi:hypothetical protein